MQKTTFKPRASTYFVLRATFAFPSVGLRLLLLFASRYRPVGKGFFLSFNPVDFLSLFLVATTLLLLTTTHIKLDQYALEDKNMLRTRRVPYAYIKQVYKNFDLRNTPPDQLRIVHRLSREPLVINRKLYSLKDLHTLETLLAESVAAHRPQQAQDAGSPSPLPT